MNSEHRGPPDTDPDWHGEKAKRARQRAIRAASLRAFVLGIAATFVITLTGIVVLTRIRAPGQPTNTGWSYVTNSGATQTALAQESLKVYNVTQTAAQIAQVDTMVSAAETATALPTVTETPSATVATVTTSTSIPTTPSMMLSTQIVAYSLIPAFLESDGIPSLRQVRVLPVAPLAGYSFGGTRFGPDGHLYVTHSRNLDMAACDPNEAYWIIDTQSDHKIDQIADPSLISPKSIAFDSADNAYILATDCKQRVHAIFKFDAHAHWVDTFPIVGGDDLAVIGDDRILVAISGFADNSVPQPHLIELRSDQRTGKLYQMAALTIGADPGGHYRSITIFKAYNQPNGSDFLYMVWAGPDAFDQLQSIGVNLSVVLENLNDSALQSGPIHDSTGALHIANLATVNGTTVVGLALDGQHAIQFQSQAGAALSFPIPDFRATSFAIDPANGYWFLAGQPGGIRNAAPDLQE